MALIAVDPSAVREYSLAGDEGAEKTVFMLGLLDPALRAHLDDAGMSYSRDESGEPGAPAAIHLHRNERANAVVRFGVRGWRSFRDGEGHDIPFVREAVDVPGVGKRQGLTEECLARLAPEWVRELADAISDTNTISEEQKKK